MKLFIFEKRTVAIAVAEVLKKKGVSFKSNKGFITLSNGDVFTYTFGHVLENKMPFEYDAKYKSWDLNHLPFFPDDWQLKVIDSKKSQFNIIKQFIQSPKVKTIVNGGDEGREGQLLIDELLIYLKCKKPVLRYLSSANDADSVLKALDNLQDNKKFKSYYESALARSRADFLIGINMTMALTNRVKTLTGKNQVISVGRVQTPTLALIVQRERVINNFVSENYYDIVATFQTENGETFNATHIMQGIDYNVVEENINTKNSAEYAVDFVEKELKDIKIINRHEALGIVEKISSKPAILSKYTKKEVVESPPLPSDLVDAQKYMNVHFNLKVSETLKLMQGLYEKSLVSYPRSDCRYLNESQFFDAHKIITSLKELPYFSEYNFSIVDPKIKSRCFNDSKVGEHHAIIPTGVKPVNLTENEIQLYKFICVNYFQNFIKNAVFENVSVELTVENEKFICYGKTIKEKGFKEFKQDIHKDTTLPLLTNQLITCVKGEVKDLKTSPPSLYTEASLIDIMQNIYKVLKDAQQRKQLKNEGLGRSATRDSIIDTLFKRGYVENKGKQIISTDLGKKLINALPNQLVSPVLTAMWEMALDKIIKEEISLLQFEKKQEEFVNLLISKVKNGEMDEHLASFPS